MDMLKEMTIKDLARKTARDIKDRKNKKKRDIDWYIDDEIQKNRRRYKRYERSR